MADGFSYGKLSFADVAVMFSQLMPTHGILQFIDRSMNCELSPSGTSSLCHLLVSLKERTWREIFTEEYILLKSGSTLGNCTNIVLEGKTPMTLSSLWMIIVIISSVCFFARNGFMSVRDQAKESLSNNDGSDEDPADKKIELRDFTIDQLRLYDGSTADTLIYISLRGDVYDVSSARNLYGVGNAYHCMAGREASRAMAKLSFDEIDLSSTRLDDLGAFERSTLDDWVEKFRHYKCYPVVGRCAIAVPSISKKTRKITRLELFQYKGLQAVPEGRINCPIYVGLKGKVFDVSFGGVDMYGVNGPYHIFAGIDASRALAKMSFDEADVSSSDVTDLNEQQITTLNEWEDRFTNVKKYPVVAYLV
jgi:membrane-associated progesterone receptor component